MEKERGSASVEGGRGAFSVGVEVSDCSGVGLVAEGGQWATLHYGGVVTVPRAADSD